MRGESEGSEADGAEQSERSGAKKRTRSGADERAEQSGESGAKRSERSEGSERVHNRQAPIARKILGLKGRRSLRPTALSPVSFLVRGCRLNALSVLNQLPCRRSLVEQEHTRIRESTPNSFSMPNTSGHPRLKGILNFHNAANESHVQFQSSCGQLSLLRDELTSSSLNQM